MVAVPDDGPPLFLDCSRQPTFAAPQPAICWSANLPPQIKSSFKMGSLIGEARASPFSRPSTTQSPQRSSPAMASRPWPGPEQGDDDGADRSVIRAISSYYAANAELPAIDTPIRRHRPQSRLTQPNSPPNVLHAVQRARLPHTLAACRRKDEVKASRTADAHLVEEPMLNGT